MFTRLCIDKILPDNIERVIYIDCDTIILDDMKQLFDGDFEDKVIMAVNDCLSVKEHEWINIKKESLGINNGVMVIDLKKWRDENIGDKLIQCLSLLPKNYPYPDQGVIDKVLEGRILKIHPKYNILPWVWLYSYKQILLLRKPYFWYSESEIAESLANPVIVHFATFFGYNRPWIIPTRQINSRFMELWKKYYSESPWFNHPLQQDKRNIFFRFCIRFYLFLSNLPYSIMA
jgi:lipopolysaccharide biosynthesis glycosyltransferase